MPDISSHHPPITACRLWNDEHGVRAEGYACQSITFSGSVNIKQTGHAILHIDKYDEDYLIPLPNVKVQGLLTGTPYPELTGTYQIASSSGFVAEIDFSGKKLFGMTGTKNAVHAALYSAEDRQRKTPLYTINGAWNDKFAIIDEASGKVIETYDTASHPATPLEVAHSELQDPWESRSAWGDTIKALNSGNIQGASDAKSRVEQGQRQMRKQDEQRGTKWEPLFFSNHSEDERYSKLSAIAGTAEERIGGYWKFDPKKTYEARKPYHESLRPDNGTV